MTLCQSRPWKVLVSIVFFLIASYQFSIAFQRTLSYASGFNQAARYVVENRKGESVLYSGVYDTGYFIFFVRKYNPERDLPVLRADKIMATSMMSRIIEERLANREDIYKVLRNFGVGYVVLMDTETGSRSLEWLREEVKSSKFNLRKKIIIRSNDGRVDNVPLVIYEYNEYTSSSEDAFIHMNIPLMHGVIEVPFRDLRKNR
jgi:hypothetical protein